MASYMGGDGFTVEPSALIGLAGEFEAIADRVARAESRFVSGAQPAAGAFGLLPQAAAAQQSYVAKAQEAIASLRGVQGAMRDSVAGGLRVVAGNYLRADQESTAGA
jgi:hypothetical protein